MRRGWREARLGLGLGVTPYGFVHFLKRACAYTMPSGDATSGEEPVAGVTKPGAVSSVTTVAAPGALDTCDAPSDHATRMTATLM